MFNIGNTNYDRPILIAGPTASGKSSLALRLAQASGGIVINADALQVYSCWRVLSARPSAEDESHAPHALYGHIDCQTAHSVGAWLRDIKPYLDDAENRLPIIVGGTGLYLTALTEGLAEIPEIPPEIRAESTQLMASDGFSNLLKTLQKEDPKTVARLDVQNPVRVQRAWEVWTATGRGLADWQDETPPPLLPLSAANAYVLNAPKDWLNPRIDNRFRQMVDEGALDECRRLLPDWSPDRPSSRAIGAKELIAHLRGEIDLETAIANAEIATRQYAKRQRSWFRARMKNWSWIDLSTELSG